MSWSLVYYALLVLFLISGFVLCMVSAVKPDTKAYPITLIVTVALGAIWLVCANIIMALGVTL